MSTKAIEEALRWGSGAPQEVLDRALEELAAIREAAREFDDALPAQTFISMTPGAKKAIALMEAIAKESEG